LTSSRRQTDGGYDEQIFAAGVVRPLEFSDAVTDLSQLFDLA
jgi:hypothetical protein